MATIVGGIATSHVPAIGKAIARYSIADIVRLSGAQGTELTTWLAMRAALTGEVTERHHNYHVPVSNTATAVMVLENRSLVLAETA